MKILLPYIALGVLCGVVSCIILSLPIFDNSNSKSQDADTKKKETTSSIMENRDYFRTVEHEGHRYVIWERYGCGGIIHDPNCPCHKRAGLDGNKSLK